MISIVGAGSFGTALAVAIPGEVSLVFRNSKDAEHAQVHRRNPRYLSDIELPGSVKCTTLFPSDSKVVFLAVPVQSLRDACSSLVISSDAILVLCSKGINNGSLSSEIVQGIFPNNELAVLSGPNFSREIATGCTSAVVISSYKTVIAEIMINLFHNSMMHVSISNDVIGVQAAGAAKNAMAIFLGMVYSAYEAQNTRALFFTMVVNEYRKIIIMLGGNAETVISVAGIGDLFLTCNSQQSRNMKFGYQIGMTHSIDTHGKTVEGINVARSLCQIAEDREMHLPICNCIVRVIDAKADAREEMSTLIALT